MKMVVQLALSAAMIALPGCSAHAPEGPAPANSPVGVEWQLLALGGVPAGVGANGKAATLTLDAVSGRASGYTGCNQFSGSYTLSGSALTFGPLAMTRMACAEGDELEHRYTMVLGETTEWRLTSKGLELRKGSTLLAKFKH